MKNTTKSATMTMAGAALALAAMSSSATAQEASPLTINREGESQVRAGELFKYELQVTNTADYPLQNVTIKENTQGRLDVRKSTPANQSAGQQQSNSAQQQGSQEPGAQQQGRQQEDRQANRGQGGSATPRNSDVRARLGNNQQSNQKDQQPAQAQWQIGWLAPGESKTVQVEGVARQEGTLNSCVAVDYNRAHCSEIEVVKPDLALDLVVLDETRTARNRFYDCEKILLSHRVKNTGSGSTNGVVLTPDAANLTLAQKRFDVGSISAGETVAEDAEVQGPVKAGVYEVQATAQSANDTVHSQRQQIEVFDPQLELTVQAPQQEFVGRTVDYVVRVKNTGDVAVPNVNLAIEQPNNLGNLSTNAALGENGAVDIGTLDAGETREVTVRGDAQQNGTATLVARASGYCAEEQTKEAAVALKGIPALVVEVVDNQDPVKIGEQTVYDINIKNQGTAEDLDVQLSATLPKTMKFVEADGDTKITANGQQLNFTNVPKLGPGEVASWQVVASAEEAGKGQLKLEVSSAATTQPVKETEPTRTF